MQQKNLAHCEGRGMMQVFIFLVLIFTGDQIHADVFQTSSTDTTVKLTTVDGEKVFGSESLLFDVKSCSEVQFRINTYEGMLIIDIYPNKTSQVKHCYSILGDYCTETMLAMSEGVCDDYTPLWAMVDYSITIGEGCDVGEHLLWQDTVLFYSTGDNIESIEVSSVENAWWRLGKSSCQPVTTPATTTTLTTHPVATPEATSESPGSLINEAKINETMPKNVDTGRSTGAVSRSNSLTWLTIVVAYVLYGQRPCILSDDTGTINIDFIVNMPSC